MINKIIAVGRHDCAPRDKPLHEALPPEGHALPRSGEQTDNPPRAIGGLFLRGSLAPPHGRYPGGRPANMDEFTARGDGPQCPL